MLAETLAGLENVEVIFRDFLRLDLRAFEAEIGEYLVVANLPYYITTPLGGEASGRKRKMSRIFGDWCRRKVAERFCAREGTPEYGAITAAIALKGEARIVKRVPRTMFFPRPNVDSAVVAWILSAGDWA